MKKLLSIFWLALMLPVAACAEQFSEGKHYEVVADKMTAKPEVMEMFSYWCPHCYNFEPIVKSIKANLAEDVEFRKVHVDFLGFASKELQQQLTKAMLAGVALKSQDKINKAIFEYIHKQRARITSIDDVRKIVQVQGIEAAKFDNAMKSFAVNGMFKKNQKELTKYQGKVTGVPAFIINGKYKLITNSVSSTEELQKLINFLLSKKN